MRIAFCLPNAEWLEFLVHGEHPDAAYIQQSYIAASLTSLGHAVTFFAPRDLEQVVILNSAGDFQTAPRSWSDTWWFNLASKLVWRFQKLLGIPYLNIFSNYRRFDAFKNILTGFDVAYERNSLYSHSVAIACERLRLPYVMFFDADQLQESDFMGKPITGLLRWRAERILRTNIRIARKIICVSEPARQNLINHWNASPDQVVVFSNAVDTAKFSPRPDQRTEIRRSLGFADAQPMVVFVGNFYHWHDVRTLLQAFASVLEAAPEARLVLVGDGVQRQDMEKYAQELNISPAVKFLGLVPHAEVPKLLSAADMGVVPVPRMDQEMWLSPMKLFEYMASGLAVVASDVGQLRSVIQSGENGLLVPPGDSARMSQAILELIHRPQWREAVGAKARTFAVQNHSWEQYAARLEQVISSTLSAKISLNE